MLFKPLFVLKVQFTCSFCKWRWQTNLRTYCTVLGTSCAKKFM